MFKEIAVKLAQLADGLHGHVGRQSTHFELREEK